MMKEVKGLPTAPVQTGCAPPSWKPHLSKISSLAVFHGQEGQVVGSQVLHPLWDIPGSHHIGMVEPSHDLDLQAPSLSIPGAELLPALLDSNLLTRFLQGEHIQEGSAQPMTKHRETCGSILKMSP